MSFPVLLLHHFFLKTQRRGRYTYKNFSQVIDTTKTKEYVQPVNVGEGREEIILELLSLHRGGLAKVLDDPCDLHIVSNLDHGDAHFTRGDSQLRRHRLDELLLVLQNLCCIAPRHCPPHWDSAYKKLETNHFFQSSFCFKKSVNIFRRNAF